MVIGAPGVSGHGGGAIPCAAVEQAAATCRGGGTVSHTFGTHPGCPLCRHQLAQAHDFTSGDHP